MQYPRLIQSRDAAQSAADYPGNPPFVACSSEVADHGAQATVGFREVAGHGIGPGDQRRQRFFDAGYFTFGIGLCRGLSIQPLVNDPQLLGHAVAGCG